MIPPVPDVSLRGLPLAPGYVKFFDRWFLARPVLMPPVWTIALLGAVPPGTVVPFAVLPAFTPRIWIGLGLCFSLAGAVYIINQVFDIDSDRINNKAFFLPRGLISIRSAIIQAVIFQIIAIAGGWFFGRMWFVCSVLIALLGVLYSIPFFRLKDRPFAGLLANAVGHGILVFYLGLALAGPEALPAWGSSIAYAFAVAGVYLLTTVPDRDGDAAAAKRTMSVFLGPQRTAVLAVICVFGALIAGSANRQWPIAITAAISLPLFFGAAFSERLCAPAIRVPLILLSFFACLAFLPYFLILLLVYFSTRWYYRRRFGMPYPRMGTRR